MTRSTSGRSWAHDSRARGPARPAPTASTFGRGCRDVRCRDVRCRSFRTGPRQPLWATPAVMAPSSTTALRGTDPPGSQIVCQGPSCVRWPQAQRHARARRQAREPDPARKDARPRCRGIAQRQTGATQPCLPPGSVGWSPGSGDRISPRVGVKPRGGWQGAFGPFFAGPSALPRHRRVGSPKFRNAHGLSAMRNTLDCSFVETAWNPVPPPRPRPSSQTRSALCWIRRVVPFVPLQLHAFPGCLVRRLSPWAPRSVRFATTNL